MDGSDGKESGSENAESSLFSRCLSPLSAVTLAPDRHARRSGKGGDDDNRSTSGVLRAKTILMA